MSMSFPFIAAGIILFCLVVCAAHAPAGEAAPAKPLPKFNTKIATMTVGRDGKVYMTSLGPGNQALVMRLNRDGTERICAQTGPISYNATANSQGVIGVDCAHTAKRVMLLSPDFRRINDFIKFGGGAFRSPARAEAGPSGDFYGADNMINRIVRFRQDGTRCGTYLIPREPKGDKGEIADFRVCEKTKTLYVVARTNTLRCFSFDSPDWKAKCKQLWSIESPVAVGEPHIGGGCGGFDVDEDGVLYVTDRCCEAVKRYDPSGKPLADIKLEMGANKPGLAESGFRVLAVWQGEALLRRVHDTELFQRYDLKTGKLINIVSAGEYEEVLAPLALADVPARPAAVKPAAPAKDPKRLRVLFLGNSQINCVCDIPEIVEDLSHSAPTGVPRIEADEVAIGGATLALLWNDGLARKKIAAGGWDWVVCHEIVYSYGGNTAKYQEYARKFAELAKKAGAKMLFYATGEVEAARAKAPNMYTDALAMARECQGCVAGGGMAWQKAWEKQPKFDFHYTDRAHPNGKGYYLNACVIFAALTDATPVGLEIYSNGMPEPQHAVSKEEGEFLQTIAWEQYQEDRRNEKR